MSKNQKTTETKEKLDSSTEQKQKHFLPSLLRRKKMELSWYIKLNIMVLGFLFVLLLMKQIRSPVFQDGLKNALESPAPPARSAKIRHQK